ncbi:MAG: DNA polymerase III subunit gamma/tau [Deltaproteobacteria bacterium]|nr:MAG: DNA polymerase III subunit gamma/tau [Deltaproteobacteria bacterium]
MRVVSYLVLARKYRPQTFEAVVGQEHVTQTLMHSISADRVAHAILFAGPRGTGKTTVARILAKAMNCEKGPTARPCNKCRSCLGITADSSADVFEIDGASNNSVDQIRQLRDNIVFMPSESRYKIYIIDEVHMLSLSAFNALLKTLEEPPSHVIFLFATTEIHKIPITILSRCQRHDMRRIDHGSIVSHLESLCEKEKIEVQPESLSLIAQQADGSMRDALSLLDQVMAGSDGAVEHEFVLSILGSVDRAAIVDLGEALISGDIRRMLLKTGEIYTHGQDLLRVYNDLLAYLRDLMVVKVARTPEKLINLSKAEIDALAGQAEKVPAAHLAWIFEKLYRDEVTVRLSSHPRMAMEMVLIKLGGMKPVLSIDTLIEKLDDLKAAFDRSPVSISDSGIPDKAPADIPRPPPVSSSSPAPPPPLVPADPEDPGQKEMHQQDSAQTTNDPDTIWAQICRQVSEASPALAANLVDSRLILKGEDRVEIEVSGGEFNLNMVRRKKNMTRLEQWLTDHFHRPMRVTIKGNVDPRRDRQAEKKKNDELKKKALTHPGVVDALEVFEGRVEKVNIKQEEDQ